jgi:hypothetical protein
VGRRPNLDATDGLELPDQPTPPTRGVTTAGAGAGGTTGAMAVAGAGAVVVAGAGAGAGAGAEADVEIGTEEVTRGGVEFFVAVGLNITGRGDTTFPLGLFAATIGDCG